MHLIEFALIIVTENHGVGGSIPPLGTKAYLKSIAYCRCHNSVQTVCVTVNALSASPTEESVPVRISSPGTGGVFWHEIVRRSPAHASAAIGRRDSPAADGAPQAAAGTGRWRELAGGGWRGRRCGVEAVGRYPITSSAMACSVGGTSMPSAFAVCMLMTNSNLVDCTTGKSAGLAPLRMLPV
jgi:hypothetical protein